MKLVGVTASDVFRRKEKRRGSQGGVSFVFSVQQIQARKLTGTG